jgi:hypothetical protein
MMGPRCHRTRPPRHRSCRWQPRHRLDDQREAFGQIVARAAIEPHPLAVLARDDTEAVVLDLMKPKRSRRRAWGRHWQARRDEARWQGTQQQHAALKVGGTGGPVNTSGAEHGRHTLNATVNKAPGVPSQGSSDHSLGMASPSGQYLAATGYLPKPPNLKLRPAFTTLLVSLMSKMKPLLKVMSRLPKS